MKTQKKFYNSKFGTMKTQKKFYNSIIRDNEDSEKQFDNSQIRDNEDSGQIIHDFLRLSV